MRNLSPPLCVHRNPNVREQMDDPRCSGERLRNTYRQFRLINSLVSGWRRTYIERIRPRFSTTEHSLIDVGSGGGDLARALVRWAHHDGVTLAVTAIDPDPRAYAYARRHSNAGVRWLQCTTSDLVAAGESADFVVSNHVLHHLTGSEFGVLLSDSERLARVAVIHSDIRRSALAYALFAALTLPFPALPPRWRSFIREDGLASIQRSFTVPELISVVPRGWAVAPQTPHRLVLTHDSVMTDA